MSDITNLHKAKNNKNDEFYTQLKDIENELKHYGCYFKDKIVYCNCDNPKWSNFWKYFEMNFRRLDLKKLIATYYEKDTQSYKLELIKNKNDIELIKTPLIGDGDFRSQECIEILKEADIIITNPPFSLFREYVDQLIKYEKKFIIIGNKNAITYKEIFPLIKDNKLWLGYGFKGGAYFIDGNYSSNHEKNLISIAAVWFTNVEIEKKYENLVLYKTYTEEEYPKYDNYDAINVNKTKDIPYDYDGVMGVPITFLYKYNPEQFEILGIAAGSKDTVGIPFLGHKIAHPLIKGKKMYARIFIQKKKR